jgi:hypothetical protein
MSEPKSKPAMLTPWSNFQRQPLIAFTNRLRRPTANGEAAKDAATCNRKASKCIIVAVFMVIGASTQRQTMKVELVWSSPGDTAAKVSICGGLATLKWLKVCMN